MRHSHDINRLAETIRGAAQTPAHDQASFALARQAVVSSKDETETLYDECLTRIQDGAGGYISTPQFLSDLRRHNGQVKFDIRVLCDILARLAEFPKLVLGCNLSPSTISQAAPQILSLIEGHSHLAKRLVLEITEDSEDIFSSRVTSLLWVLQKRGVRIALDDFGSGYATPSALMNMSVDIIKIDKTLLGARKSFGGRTALEHLVGFASCLAPCIVVEGVETDEQADLVRKSGASHMQGYLIGRPVLDNWAPTPTH